MGELSSFAKMALGVCFGLFIALLLGIPLFPGWMAKSVFAGVTWGHLIMIGVHVIPVGLAWSYILKREDEPS